MIRCTSLSAAAVLVVCSIGIPQITNPIASDWQDLASDDATLAYLSLWRLAQNPEAAKLLGKHLTPAAAPDLEKIQGWVDDLSSLKFAVRDKASTELALQGELAEPVLRKVLAGQPDLETKRRVELLLNKLEQPVTAPEKLRMIRAVEVLEMVGTAEAVDLLQRLAKGFAGHRLTREAQESVKRLGQRAPVPERWLAWAKSVPPLADKDDPLPFGVRGRLGTTLFRHHNNVFGGQLQCLFSPDSRSIISNDAKAIYVWEAKTGKLQRKFELAAECLAVAPKGTLLAVGLRTAEQQNGFVVWWDWQAGKELGRVTLPVGVAPQQLGFSPDEARVICRSSDQTIRSWDASSRKEIKEWKPGGAKQELLGFSLDGNRVVTKLANTLYVLDRRKGTKHLLQAAREESYQAVFSADGKYLASRDNGEGPRIWDAATGKLLWQAGDEGLRLISPIGFSPNGKILAASAYRAEISLWDTHTGKFLKSLPGSKDARMGSISPDGRWLATTGATIKVWNLETGNAVDSGEGHQHQIDHFHFSPRYDLLATSAGDSVILWDVISGKLKQRLPTGHWPRGLAFSPDGQWVATSDFDDSVRLWESATGRQIFKLAGHGPVGGRRLVQFSPDNRFLFSWGDDFRLRKWDVKTGKALLEKRTRPRGLEFPKDEEAPLDRFDVFDFCSDCHFTQQADQLVLLSMECDLHFFDTATGKEARVVNVGMPDLAGGFAVSPNNKHVAVRGYEAPLDVIDLASGRRAFSIPLTGGPGNLLFSPDGRTLVGTNNKKLFVVEMATGKIRLEVEAKSRQIELSPDGRFLATAMPDTTALVWDLAVLSAAAKK